MPDASPPPRPVTVLLGDPDLPDRTKPGSRYTPDDLDQVVRLRVALAQLERYRCDVWDDHVVLLERLRRERPPFVVNFCDNGFRNDPRQELHVAAYLELLGLAYSGSGPVALGLCFDKGLVRAVAGSIGLPVPAETYLGPGEPLPPGPWPAFVKPNRGDGSLGIGPESIVPGRAEAERLVARLRAERPGEAVLVQQFLPGAEYSVAVIGNPEGSPVRLGSPCGPFAVLPILEVDYSGLPAGLPRLLDYGSKTDPTSPYWTDVRFREAGLPAGERARLAELCTRLFTRLGLRDYGRFDFRTDAEGVIRLLEVNPNPAWSHDGKLAVMAGLGGGSHADLLGAVVDTAWRRCTGAPG